MSKFKVMYRPRCSVHSVVESQNSRRDEQKKNESFQSNFASTKKNQVKNQSDETKFVDNSINSIAARSTPDTKMMKKFPELVRQSMKPKERDLYIVSSLIKYPNIFHFFLVQFHYFSSWRLFQMKKMHLLSYGIQMVNTLKSYQEKYFCPTYCPDT